MPRPTPRKPDRPTLWIVAGHNGSGKSSLYSRTDIEGWGGSVWIINPDLLTQQIVETEQVALASANLVALQRIQRWLDASIDAYQTIGVETVLSSSKYRHLVQWARLRGFRVNMIYVFVVSAAVQIRRIRTRVAEGGHDVPVDKTVDRRRRSFGELAWFLRHVDQCHLFDNSTQEPSLAGELAGGRLVYHDILPPDMRDILAGHGVEMVDWIDHVLG